MPNLKLVVFTLVLVAGAVVATLVDTRSSPVSKDARLGKSLLASDGLAEIDQISLGKGEATFSLHRSQGGRWSIGESAGFPADASKIARMLDDLTKIKFIRVVAEEQEKWGEFGLTQPTKVALLAGDRQLLDFQIGSRGSSGGFYGTVGGEYKVYLFDPEVTIGTDESTWELKELVDLEADTVKSVTFQPNDKMAKAVTLMREKKEDELKVEGLVDNEESNPSTANSQAAILSGIRYNKRLDTSNEEAKTALANPNVVSVTLFDGRQYKAEVGRVGSEQPKYFIRVTAEVGQAKLDDTLNQDLALLNDLMKGWSFEVSSSIGSKFEKTRADFVKAKDPATGG